MTLLTYPRKKLLKNFFVVTQERVNKLRKLARLCVGRYRSNCQHITAKLHLSLLVFIIKKMLFVTLIHACLSLRLARSTENVKTYRLLNFWCFWMTRQIIDRQIIDHLMANGARGTEGQSRNPSLQSSVEACWGSGKHYCVILCYYMLLCHCCVILNITGNDLSWPYMVMLHCCYSTVCYWHKSIRIVYWFHMRSEGNLTSLLKLCCVFHWYV
jgi:hypothetical protein